jgi:hypothetical protein
MHAAARERRPPGPTAKRALAAVAAGWVALSLFGPSAATAKGADGGAAVIMDTGTGNPGTEKPLNAGGSATNWSMKLPSGTACSQDTANHQYHVFGYIVDSTQYPDPGTLTFDSNGPVASNGALAYPLVDQFGSPYVSAATAPTTAIVINIPTFNFNAFSIDGRNGTPTLPAGTYNVGIACAKADNTGDMFWNAKMIFSASGSDAQGEEWSTVASGPPPTTTTTTSSTTSTSSSSTTSTTSSTSTTSTTSSAVTSTGTTGTPADPAAANTSSSGSLARTGSSTFPSVLLAGAFIYVGYVVVLLARRRQFAVVHRPLNDPDGDLKGPEDRRQ